MRALVVAAVAMAGLSACAIPPYDDFRAGPGACLVVGSSGFMFDRNCTRFELAWLPGAQRLTVGQRGPDDIEILEVSGRHRLITVRRIREGYYCALARDYPRPRVTRDCRTTDPVHPPISVRG
ncbi:hypothetical protein [Phreatobacter stygius]|uniref:Lipoprotein n=1 Tax=Phreatobacter stygius TaxID=1940610 RepID=A0A4D7BDU7_9HYPH|nr:hypothetical protein [Phreatobacter stygius]QCI66117.1 hypothetical protein E8M01_19025 [Phreatobacter stygius]